MALSQSDRLRQLLGEKIPDGGTDEDTMFTDEEIQSFLDADNPGSSLNLAAYHGWQAKAAELANLVNVTEGNASREMGELHKNAIRMVGVYQAYSNEPTGRGRARIGTIRRPLPGNRS